MTVKTINKTIEFEKLASDFKRFTNRRNELSHHKVLDYLYYDGKYLIATDSHKLIKINADYVSNIPFIEDDTLYDLKNKKIIDKVFDKRYPNVNRLIPTISNTDVKLNYNELNK